ncbi:MAG TPA: hypothetical protein VJ183_15615 [Chloroflexia bacterium]|nr:hypothetical protein [Chloroflexia bacterium]
MVDAIGNTPRKTQNSKFKIQNWIVRLFWLVPALAVTLLALRFGMRLLGVRPDIPFPGFVYSLTAPLVEPFYRFFPVSDRFDYYAIEWAALLAAGCVLAAALVIYVAGLLLGTFLSRSMKDERASGGPQT